MNVSERRLKTERWVRVIAPEYSAHFQPVFPNVQSVEKTEGLHMLPLASRGFRIVVSEEACAVHAAVSLIML